MWKLNSVVRIVESRPSPAYSGCLDQAVYVGMYQLDKTKGVKEASVKVTNEKRWMLREVCVDRQERMI